MSDSWLATTWGQVVSLEYGKGLRDYRTTGGKVPVYGTNGAIGWTDSALCHTDGVVIGRKGAYRGVHYSRNPFFVIDTAFYLRPLVELDMRWAYYQLLTVDINGMDSGSAIPSTSREDFYKLPVNVPSFPEQQRIAQLLSQFDDRIELLRATNETLEAIAQALFKSWFVDFDPVRAKSEGRTPEGMDEATAALFPDTFEDSPLGQIPTNWGSGNLGHLASLNPESWTASKHPDFVRYVDLSNTKANRVDVTDSIPFDEAPSRARRALRDHDTIVGTVRPGNRSFAYIYGATDDLTGSTGFAVLRPKKPIDAAFVYLGATKDSSIEHLAHTADGGAYPAVRPEVVAALSVAIPSRAVLDVFGEVAIGLLNKAGSNEKEAECLGRLRDSLLPRLISGQLRVHDVEMSRDH